MRAPRAGQPPPPAHVQEMHAMLEEMKTQMQELREQMQALRDELQSAPKHDMR
jgi:phage shock protein A